MSQLPFITRYIASLLIAIMSFSITHAKDVTASVVSSGSKTSSVVQVATAKQVDNGIHLEVHTHVDRQSLSSLMLRAQSDRPVADYRSLKRFVVTEEKQAFRTKDGMLGMHVLPIS
jgi:hypothetical protein